MERDRKDDGGLVSREEEGEDKEEEEGGGSKAGDEMRQRLQAGFKPAMVRVSAACAGASAPREECIFKELDHDVMVSQAAPLSYIVSAQRYVAHIAPSI